MPEIFVPAKPLLCYSNPSFVPFPNCIVKSDDRCLFELYTFGIDMCHLNCHFTLMPICILRTLPESIVGLDTLSTLVIQKIIT